MLQSKMMIIISSSSEVYKLFGVRHIFCALKLISLMRRKILQDKHSSPQLPSNIFTKTWEKMNDCNEHFFILFTDYKFRHTWYQILLFLSFHRLHSVAPRTTLLKLIWLLKNFFLYLIQTLHCNASHPEIG